MAVVIVGAGVHVVPTPVGRAVATNVMPTLISIVVVAAGIGDGEGERCERER
jgi:hypothetical protein